eukprot:6180336-Pleurochrysis_carterae.AAC.2
MQSQHPAEVHAEVRDDGRWRGDVAVAVAHRNHRCVRHSTESFDSLRTATAKLLEQAKAASIGRCPD